MADAAARTGRGALTRSAALFCLLALGAGWSGAKASTKPYIPKSDAVVLQHVPPASNPKVKRMRAMHRRLAADPNNMKLAVKLARAYAGFGRHRGDARYLGYAMATITPWLDKSPRPIPIAMMHATLKQARHHFAEARAELRRILARNPDDGQAWLTLASVAIVQSDFKVARAACAHILTAQDRMISAGCIADLAQVTGNAAAGYRLLAGVMKAEPLAMQRKAEPKAADGIRAWADVLMADAARRLGWSKKAEAHYKEALKLSPGDNFTLSHYGDFLLAHNRPREALELLKPYQRSDTSFLRYVFAEAALGSPQTAHDIQEMVGRFKAMDLRGTHVYRREEVRFVLNLLHQPKRALKLAQQNWKVQRGPWDIRVFLAAALAAHQPRAALPALKDYEESHLQDPHIAPLAAKLKAQLKQLARSAPAPSQASSGT